MLVDVHCHLNYDSFKKDVDKVVERAEKASFSHIVTSGTSLQGNKECLELSGKFGIVYPSLGLYPVEALELSEEQLQDTIDFIKKNRDKILSVGEVGLDYHIVKNRNEEQKEIFLRMISLAEKLKLPLVIHSRKAEEDCIDILESSNAKKVVMHCFGGKLKLVKRCESNNWLFSIPPNIVFSTHFQAIVRQVSISQLLTETDSPFLSPKKGKRNEPSNIVYTIKEIAKIKNLEIDEVKKIIFANFQKIFLKNIKSKSI